MGLTQYQILNSDGSPGGVQVCQNDACFPQLLPGQTRSPMTNGGEMAAPRVTTVAADGTLQQPLLPATPPPARPQEPALPRDIPAAITPEQVFTPGAPASVQPEPSTLAPAPYVAPPPAQPPPVAPQPRMANVPPYATGQMHPAAGGQPLVAGGPFNQNPQQRGYQQQVYVPGGAAAGPYETRAAIPPRGGNANYGGSGGGGGGGGGGSLARSMYWRIRNNVESKLRGMGGGGGSYRGGGYGGGSSAQYRRQQRRYKQQQRRISHAYNRYNKAIQNPPPQKATGWAKEHLGANKGMYPAMLSNPMWVASKGMGFDPEDQANLGAFNFLNALPVVDLAMITGGTSGKGLTRQSWTPKVPHILKKQKGFKPWKPDFKRTLDYSELARQLATMYGGLSSEGGNVLDFGNLMGQMAHASHEGALGMGIWQQAKYDPAGAMDRARGYFDSVIAATQPDFKASVYSAMADQYFASAGKSMMNRKWKQADRIVPMIARRFV